MFDRPRCVFAQWDLCQQGMLTEGGTVPRRMMRFVVLGGALAAGGVLVTTRWVRPLRATTRTRFGTPTDRRQVHPEAGRRVRYSVVRLLASVPVTVKTQEETVKPVGGGGESSGPR